MADTHGLDANACFAAIRGKDARFDGVFFSGVATTGIYCRPSCPAVTPNPGNLSYFSTAAAAQEAGFRACKRCRPDAAPGSPSWNVRADLVGRAMRLISDGEVDRTGVAGLAHALGYSERQLNRQLVAELGVGPLALARSQRARTARILLETSTIPIGEVAFAAGFASVRQFNATVREVFAATPTQLRGSAVRRREEGDVSPVASESGSVAVRLAYRRPMDLCSLLGFLGGRCVAGIEQYEHGTYSRSMSLPHGSGVVALSAPKDDLLTSATGYVQARFWLDDLRDLSAAVQRCRQMLDLDSDPVAIDDHLARDPLLKSLVNLRPGLRMPGSTDPNEVAVRVVIGQQVSTAGARTVAGRLVARYGSEVTNPVGTVTHTFPQPGVLAEADPEHLAMPMSRKKAIKALATALADGSVVLNQGSDRDEVEAKMLRLHGVGPWTVAAVRMRGLGDPDVFLATDLGIQRAVDRLGARFDPKALESSSQAWKPWRSYTTHHLWATLDSAAPQTRRTGRTREKGER